MKFLSILVLSLGMLFSSAVLAEEPVYQKDGLAIDGYDPVAYFTIGKAMRGNADFSTEYRGAVWQFMSEEHKAAFLAEPEKYAPQYGGHCAFAASKGYVAKSEGDQWSVVNGKLYLNYNQVIKSRWDSSRQTFINAAKENWSHN